MTEKDFEESRKFLGNGQIEITSVIMMNHADGRLSWLRNLFNNLFKTKKMITLSQNAAGLIKYVLTFTGEKEINPRGQEVDSQRRLNGEESSQRRFYLKAVDPLLEEKQIKVKAIQDEAKKVLDAAKETWKTANPKGEKEEQVAYEARMNKEVGSDEALKDAIKTFNEQIDAVNEEKIEFELAPKTVDVVKKYLAEFGTKVGWIVGDEEPVNEINEVLK